MKILRLCQNCATIRFMKTVKLGNTGIEVPQNAFGALPIQRDNVETAVSLLQQAYRGGMTFFDTARAYSDSEEKVGIALSDVRQNIIIATKTGAKTPEELMEHFETSLKLLKTDYVDIYQFHCADRVWRPGDGTGMYECMQKLKKEGRIRHIGITAHKIGVAEEAVDSGLYETLQFPFSYLSSPRELALVERCKEKGVGFIAMKALAGGLITSAKAAFAFVSQYDNVVPIWGIQRQEELDQWLSFFDKPAEMDEEVRGIIEKDKSELNGDFCRGCGYCMPCPQGIVINQCARMSLMLRRAPSKAWLSERWQQAMSDIQKCTGCGKCRTKCPYELNTPELLKKNYDDYQNVLAGTVSV